MKNSSIFFTEPDTVDEMRCKICEAVCKVGRRIYGPTSFGESMAHKSHTHDRFECPHNSEKWHEQAIELVEAIKNSPSASIRAIMQRELDEILHTKKATI